MDLRKAARNDWDLDVSSGDGSAGMRGGGMVSFPEAAIGTDSHGGAVKFKRRSLEGSGLYQFY